MRNILIQPIILDFYSELRAFGAPFTLSLVLRLCGRPARDGCESALWDCFGGRIFNMASNLSPKTVPQCTFTTISTRSPAQPQSGESDREHFELLSHETFAKLNVGVIAFESISLLLPNLCLLLIIVLEVRVITFFLFILFRWNACWSTRSDAFLFRHARRPCCSCPLKEALYSEEVLLKFKSLAPKISRAPRM